VSGAGAAGRAGAGTAPGRAGAGATGDKGADATDAAARVFRLVVLASGSGSNLQAIIDKLHGRPVAAGDGAALGAAGMPSRGAAALRAPSAAETGAALPGAPTVEVALVVSDVPGARALDRARQAGIPTALCPVTCADDREKHGGAVLAAVSKANPDLVVLAGYMRIVPQEFVRAFRWRIINLHPALLPAFPGTTSISDAVHHGVKVTGVTVHFVDEGLDTGPIIAQEAVRVEEGDTPESLAARIHALEHELLPATIRLIAAGKVSPPLPGTRVVQVDWDGGEDPCGGADPAGGTE
jgi:phosphoribosylglycinamide formyltransferase-1